jgi:uncharacterized protein
MKIIIFCIVFVSILFSCQVSNKDITKEDHLQEIEDWHATRIESLKSENGFLNIVGLQGLKIGVNSFGSSSENDLVFELKDFPNQVGLFTLNNDEVYFEALVDGVLYNEMPVNEKIKVLEKGNSESLYFSMGRYFWNVIKRHSFYGIRIREKESNQVNSFTGIKRYPVDLAWRVKSGFHSYEPKKMINIPNIFGESNLQESPGYVEFKLGNNTFKLDVLEGDSESYFLIFSDQTSGVETYGGGRYLYINKPDKNGETIIDFNKSYNPPCVYTPYATCPLTPKQNVLDFKIKAGETSPAK